jgi:hypothetical protein
MLLVYDLVTTAALHTHLAAVIAAALICFPRGLFALDGALPKDSIYRSNGPPLADSTIFAKLAAIFNSRSHNDRVHASAAKAAVSDLAIAITIA